MRDPVSESLAGVPFPRTHFGGETQKIFPIFKRLMANPVPTVRTAGNAGGTTTVTRSSDLIIMWPADD